MLSQASVILFTGRVYDVTSCLWSYVLSVGVWSVPWSILGGEGYAPSSGVLRPEVMVCPGDESDTLLKSDTPRSRHPEKQAHTLLVGRHPLVHTPCPEVDTPVVGRHPLPPGSRQPLTALQWDAYFSNSGEAVFLYPGPPRQRPSRQRPSDRDPLWTETALEETLDQAAKQEVTS